MKKPSSVVVQFPGRKWRHARASDGSAAKTSNVTDDSLLRLASLTSCAQRDGGKPRRRQCATVDLSTSKSAATAVVPPRSSMIEVGVMPTDTSWQIANRQGLANCQLTVGRDCVEIPFMAQPPKLIGQRIRRTREALNANGPEFAAWVGTDKSTLSNIEKGKRNFTLAMAVKLKKNKNIPLDWIFCGDPSGLSTEIFNKLAITKAA